MMLKCCVDHDMAASILKKSRVVIEKATRLNSQSTTNNDSTLSHRSIGSGSVTHAPYH
jgi:hypothetical protein